MGMYNLLLVPDSEKCAQCGRETTRFIQFYYGAQTLREYALGERIEWGGASQEGVSGHHHVALKGFNTGCPHCGYDDDMEFRIDIVDDVIVSAVPDDGTTDFLAQDHYYWVVLED
ncbi:hypothetical protein LX86_001886 [Lentzea aerocolonigenes]|nr:hypothetical protein [Lentzea aerocolonigenes]